MLPELLWCTVIWNSLVLCMPPLGKGAWGSSVPFENEARTLDSVKVFSATSRSFVFRPRSWELGWAGVLCECEFAKYASFRPVCASFTMRLAIVISMFNFAVSVGIAD